MKELCIDEIYTRRLTLINLLEDEFEEYLKYNEVKYINESSTYGFFQNYWIENELLVWVVKNNKNDEFIGNCVLKRVDNNNELELTCFFDTKYRKSGYEIETTEAIVEFASNILKIEKLIALIGFEDSEFCKAIKKLGFKFKGINNSDFRSTNQFELELKK